MLALVAFRVETQSLSIGMLPGSLTDLRGRPVRCAALVRHNRPLPAPSATTLEERDEVWLLASPDQVEYLTPPFWRLEQSGHLAVRNFFGEFVLDADSSAAALAATYDLTLDEDEIGSTIGELLSKRLGRRPVDVSLSVHHGEASRIILTQEQEQDCDLIVMGKHGQGVLEELLLGSVTKHILSESASDVLVVGRPAVTA